MVLAVIKAKSTIWSSTQGYSLYADVASVLWNTFVGNPMNWSSWGGGIYPGGGWYLIPIKTEYNLAGKLEEGAGEFTATVAINAIDHRGVNIFEGESVQYRVSGIDSDDLEKGDLEGFRIVRNGKIQISHALKIDEDVGERYNLTLYNDRSETYPASRFPQIGEALSLSITESPRINNGIGAAGSIIGNSSFDEGVVLIAPEVKGDPDGDAINPNYGYQWFKNGSRINGATNKSYATSKAGGAGSYKVAINYTDAEGYEAIVESPEQAISMINNGNGSSGVITGNGLFKQGVILFAPRIAGDPDGDSANPQYTYQWYKDNDLIPYATGEDFVVDSYWRSGSFKVAISYTDGQGYRSTVNSNPQLVIADSGEGTVSAITGNGDFKQGVTLIAGVITGDPDGNGRINSYKWFKDGKAIANASEFTYNTADQGSGTYKVSITYTDDKGFTATVDSDNRFVGALPTPQTQNYSLSTSTNSINEGSTLTTTVSTNNVASGTTLYYSLSGTGINTSDFSSGSLTGSGTVSSSGSFSFSHTLANDLTTEGTETLEIKLFPDSSRSTQVASTSVSISDTSRTPTYSLTPSSTSINEGSTLTTTVGTTNVESGTALYYSLSGTGITTADFSSGSLTGSGTVSSSGSFSFSHTLANDLTTEGTETLNIKLYSDSSRSTQVGSTASVSILDTSVTPQPTYSITSSASTVNEGDGFTTTLATTGVAAGTTYYWVRSGSGITSTDFIYGGLSGSGSIGSDGRFSYTHLTSNDLTTEGDEYVEFRIFSDSNRSQQVGSTASILIRDTSITPVVSGVTVNGNNSGIANSGTINNNGTINTGTQTTNSNNTTTNTTNNTTNNINNFFTYYTNTTNNTNSNNTVTNTNSNNTISTWNIYRVDNSVKAGDIVNQWFGNTTPAQKQVQDLTDTKLMDIVASSWSDKVQINRVAKASDNGDILEGKQRDANVDGVVGSVLTGGKGSDRIQAMAGWDIVEGGEGNDLVRAGNGRDILSGGSGKDELWGGFGWNTYKGDKDGSEDLLVIKSDEWQVNPLNGKAGNNPDGSKCDIIEELDSIDKIIIQGVNTSDLRFEANVKGQGLTGIGIYAKGALEALYTGGDLTVAQLTAMTTGDITGPANGTYWVW